MEKFLVGLDGKILGWAGRTRLLFAATGMDWTGLDLMLWMGLDYRHVEEKLLAKCSVMPYFAPNVLRYVRLNTFSPCELIIQVRNDKRNFCAPVVDWTGVSKFFSAVLWTQNGWTNIVTGWTGWTYSNETLMEPGWTGLHGLLKTQWASSMNPSALN